MAWLEQTPQISFLSLPPPLLDSGVVAMSLPPPSKSLYYWVVVPFCVVVGVLLMYSLECVYRTLLVNS